MTTAMVDEIVHNLYEPSLPLDFGPGRSRLLIRVVRTLACGRPVTVDQVDQMAARLDMSPVDARQFLKQVSERDAEGRIIGALGLSLHDQWAHRFYVNGIPLRTWCAWDALFLPPILNRNASIVSFSPVGRKEVRLTVSPHQVEWSYPEGAVVSMVDFGEFGPGASSVEAIWSSFCHRGYFCPTEQEAEEWAEDQENISILSVEEGYELGKRTFSKLLAYM